MNSIDLTEEQHGCLCLLCDNGVDDGIEFFFTVSVRALFVAEVRVSLPLLNDLSPLQTRFGEFAQNICNPRTRQPFYLMPVEHVRDRAQHETGSRLAPMVIQTLALRIDDDAYDLLNCCRLGVRPGWDQLEGIGFGVGDIRPLPCFEVEIQKNLVE